MLTKGGESFWVIFQGAQHVAEQETQRFSFLGGSLCHWTCRCQGHQLCRCSWACLGHAHLQHHVCLTSMALVSLPSWHDTDFSIQLLVTSWIAATPVQSPAATLLFISLEIILAWNKGELKQWSCSSVLRDCCTVHHWLCSEQIPGLAWPLSSRSCMSHWCPGYLCEPSSAAAIQSSSPLCLDLLLLWLSLAPVFSADSHSAHVPSIGPWFWDITSLFISSTPCAVWVLKQGFAGEKINFQAVQGKEGVC